MPKQTSKNRTSAKLKRRKPVQCSAMVGTLVRQFKTLRRQTLANEKEMSAGRMYKRAIQCQAQAETLTIVINALKGVMRSNAPAERPEPNPKP